MRVDMRMMIPDRPARSVAARQPIRSTTVRVLLVEDEPRLREMLLRAVTDMGFDVHGVSTAEGAIRAMNERASEIVLLDLNLPGMGGMELFGAIRRAHP